MPRSGYDCTSTPPGSHASTASENAKHKRPGGSTPRASTPTRSRHHDQATPTMPSRRQARSSPLKSAHDAVRRGFQRGKAAGSSRVWLESQGDLIYGQNGLARSGGSPVRGRPRNRKLLEQTTPTRRWSRLGVHAAQPSTDMRRDEHRRPDAKQADEQSPSTAPVKACIKMESVYPDPEDCPATWTPPCQYSSPK